MTQVRALREGMREGNYIDLFFLSYPIALPALSYANVQRGSPIQTSPTFLSVLFTRRPDSRGRCCIASTVLTNAAKISIRDPPGQD